jgi:hypothetical protein
MTTSFDGDGDDEHWDDDDLSDEELHGFVDAYVVPWAVDRHRAGTGIWCPQWHKHPDVVLRLAELTGSRAALFETEDDVDRVAIGRWWVDLLDRHIAAVCAIDGPLRRCRHGHQDNAEQTPLRFKSVHDWYASWFALIWTRRPVDLWWCDQWHQHPEVLLQLIELWILWETARHQPGAMLSWWEQAHRTMAHITAENGPMAACKTGRSHETRWVTLDGQPIDPANSAERTS